MFQSTDEAKAAAAASEAEHPRKRTDGDMYGEHVVWDLKIQESKQLHASEMFKNQTDRQHGDDKAAASNQAHAMDMAFLANSKFETSVYGTITQALAHTFARDGKSGA